MTKTLYGLLSQDYREYQLKESVKAQEKRSKSFRKSLKESTNVNIDSAGNVNVSVTPDTPIHEPVPVEPEVAEVEDTEVIEEAEETTEAPAEEVIETAEATDTPAEEVTTEPVEAIAESEEPCKECGKIPCECDASGKKKEPLKDTDEELIKSSIEEPHEILEDETATEPDAKAALLKIINIIKDEGSIDPDIAKEIAKDFIEPEESTEDSIDSELEECEISSYKITRIAPKFNAYMLEAQTKDGLRYITGKNFNESEKTIDEAEISEDKTEASNRFKDLLK